MVSLPIGLSLINRTCVSVTHSATIHKVLILVMTYFAYTAYHLSRRPLSVVKNQLNRNCSDITPPSSLVLNNVTRNSWCDWEPFTGPDANSLLGVLDSSFLFSYAIFMFISGFVAERCHLRYFLSFGMILSGIFVYLFGIAYYYNIHSLPYFIIVQIISGALQSSGWPAVVACVGNWFGSKSSRGLIFGIWNSHTNVGNILGATISGSFVESNWGLSFIIPGIIIAVIGFFIFLFLAPYPEEIGFPPVENTKKPKGVRNIESHNDDNDNQYQSASGALDSAGSSLDSRSRRCKMRRFDEVEDAIVNEEECPLIPEVETHIEISHKHAVSFIGALKIPGVIEFSLCLFFAKLVSYTFLYWLPKYIGDSTDSSSAASAYLSTPFDIGGIVGAVMAGYLVDKTGASATICIIMLLCAIPSLYLYQLYGSVSNLMNIILQLISGAFVNGPYALITTAVSADLGSKADETALATVTAIIDGTGSIGAAIGPFLAGLVSETGWDNVFYMVMAADLLALISLIRIARQELIKKARKSHHQLT